MIMEQIKFEELKHAALVFERIGRIRQYVTRERFALMAKTRYGIDDEYVIDQMYGTIQAAHKMVYYIARYGGEDVPGEHETKLKLLQAAIEIAESAYSMMANDWEAEEVPHIEYNDYRRKDRRRYYYTDGDDRRSVEIDLSSRSDILMLAQLLQRDGVSLVGVSEHIGYLESVLKGTTREKFHYFEGDIYLLSGDTTDNVFYSYINSSSDAGVYVATPDGWRKLLYTPKRGYVTKQGELDFEDDDRFYSNYMLEQSGMRFLYVGNIHDDMSVLVEKRKD